MTPRTAPAALAAIAALLALVALIGGGCPAAPPPPAPPFAPRGDRPAPIVRLADGLGAARIDLPEPGPAPHDITGARTLTGWSPHPDGVPDLWTLPCPVLLPQERYPRPPEGMVLRSGTTPLRYRYGASTQGLAAGDWELAEGSIWLVSPSDPGTWPEPPQLDHPATALAEARLNWGPSGLDPATFTRVRAALGRVTRDALLVPAPGSLALDVAIGPRQQLRFGFGVQTPPVRVERAAVARGVVRIDGEVVWEGRGVAGDPWQEAVVDLAAHAGRTVTVRFESLPDGEPTRDYVMWGTPEVVHAEGNPRRVVVVGIDTLRVDHLGVSGYDRPTSPELDAIAAESRVYTHARAPAPRTRPSFRTALTGRWPLSAIAAPSIASVLAGEGFATAGVVANVHLAPRLGLSEGFDWWDYDNGQIAAVQIDRALDWLASHRHDDAFLFVHLMDPHVFYDAPPPHGDLFADPDDRQGMEVNFNRWDLLARAERRQLDEGQKRWITARYDGELHYVSSQMGRLVDALDALPGQTTLVILSDHGEELWEHGGFEHNHTLYDELMRVLLWFRPPGGWSGGPHRDDAPVSLADLASTLFDLLDVPAARRPPSDGTSLRTLLDGQGGATADGLRAGLAARPLPMGHLMYDREQWGVVLDGWKYILETAGGRERLFDLRADPGELRDLMKPGHPELDRLRAGLAQATGWPVERGWRFRFERLRRPLDLVFNQPVRAAGVIDPEAERQRRANQEWGEAPERTRDDVAQVAVSPDGLTVRLSPGPQGKGIVWVVGPDEGATIVGRSLDREVPMAAGRSSVGGTQAEAWYGTLIQPPTTEADQRLTPDAEALRALQVLGYIE